MTSQGAWACQRGVRWDDWLLLRTYYDGFKTTLEDVMLYDLATNPHETENLADAKPTVVRTGLAKLQSWYDERMTEAALDRAGGNPSTPNGVTDPLWQVLAEGGPFHTRGHLESYYQRLRETGRPQRAEQLAEAHGEH